MAFLEESAWRGKVYSGGWRPAIGGEGAVIEPATGTELSRTGIREGGKIGPAAQFETHVATGARFGGTANLEAFTDTRWVTLRGDIATYPF